MGERIERVRGADQTGEHRALCDGEFLRVDPEVRASRGLHTVRPLAEVDGIQVLGQDLVLGEPVLELPGEDRLVDLAAQRLVVAHVELFDELLGDGGSTFDDAAGRDIGVGRTQDRPEIHPVVEEEPFVFDRDRCVADRLWHLRSREDDPVFTGMELGDEAPVGGIEERRFRERQRLSTVVRQAWQPAAGRRDQREYGRGEGESPALPHSGESTGGVSSHW